MIFLVSLVALLLGVLMGTLLRARYGMAAVRDFLRRGLPADVDQQLGIVNGSSTR